MKSEELSKRGAQHLINRIKQAAVDDYFVGEYDFTLEETEILRRLARLEELEKQVEKLLQTLAVRQHDH